MGNPDRWIDGSDNWDTPTDWSSGEPVSTTSVYIDMGNPQVTSPIAINSLTVYGAQLTFDGPGTSTVKHSVLSDGGGFTIADGAVLSVGKAIASRGQITISSGGQLTAATLQLNRGSVILNGWNGKNSSLDIAGAVHNYGYMVLHHDTQTFATGVTGHGSFFLYQDSTIGFDSIVGRAEIVALRSPDTLVLGDAHAFGASIRDFGSYAGQSVEIENFAKTKPDFAFTPNAKDTGGVLALTDGAKVADLHFYGQFQTSDFAVAAGPVHGDWTITFN